MLEVICRICGQGDDRYYSQMIKTRFGYEHYSQVIINGYSTSINPCIGTKDNMAMHHDGQYYRFSAKTKEWKKVKNVK